MLLLLLTSQFRLLAAIREKALHSPLDKLLMRRAFYEILLRTRLKEAAELSTSNDLQLLRPPRPALLCSALLRSGLAAFPFRFVPFRCCWLLLFLPCAIIYGKLISGAGSNCLANPTGAGPATSSPAACSLLPGPWSGLRIPCTSCRPFN